MTTIDERLTGHRAPASSRHHEPSVSGQDADEERRRQRLSRLAASTVAGVLAADGLLHLVWATGLSWPFVDAQDASVAVLGFAVPFTPGVLLPLVALLWTAAAAVFARGHLDRSHRLRPVLQGVTMAVTGGLLARGLFGIAWAAADDGALSPTFRVLNLLVYTPLCLLLAGAGWLLLGPGRRPGRARRWTPARLAATVVPVLLLGTVVGAAYAFSPQELHFRPQQALDGVPSRFVDTPTARFHYLQKGSGSPVVLLSPGSAWANAWLPQLHALSTTNTVYVVDLPGQGFTTLNDPHFVFDLDGMTGAVGAFLDAIDVPQAALAGNSWSGGWALAYAQRHPDRVISLLLLDSSGLDRPDPLGWEILKLPVVGRAIAQVTAGSRSMTESGLRGLFVHQDLVTPPLVDAFRAAAGRPESVRATYELEARLDWSQTDAALPATRQPTLVLWGAQDSVLPVDQAAGFGDKLPDAEVRVLEGCGHAITLDCPERVSEQMAGFLHAR